MTAYRDIPAINWSLLKHIRSSPLAYQWAREHPEPDKPAWVAGRALHTLVLEPDAFEARYAIWPADAGQRRGKEWQAFQADAGEREIIREQDLVEVRDMEAAICSGPQGVSTRRLLAGGGKAEEVLTWTDPATGIACKGRVDTTAGRIVDLKTTRRIEPRAFGRDAAAYLYHAQLAWYHDGALAAGRHLPELPAIIAIESAPPYDVAVYELAEADLAAGRAIYQECLRRLVACQEADYWPGVAPDPQRLMLPPWAPGFGPAETPAGEEGF